MNCLIRLLQSLLEKGGLIFMKNLASKLLRRRLRQVFLWPIEALFGFGLFYFARLLPTTFASAAMAAFLGILPH